MRPSVRSIAVDQKAIFADLKARLGGRGVRALLVEDNKINQTVMITFFKRVEMDVDCAGDGMQCLDMVFSKPHDYYSVILSDLFMPALDGFQTTKAIRKWERKSGHPRLPIIALSANVMGDVYTKVVDAGFDEFCTKPVDFKELSRLLVNYLDPDGITDPESSLATTGTKPSLRKSGRSSATASDGSRTRGGGHEAAGGSIGRMGGG